MYNIGDKVLVYKNTVFKYMGFKEVTGTITALGIGIIYINCNETDCVEAIELGDGRIKILK